MISSMLLQVFAQVMVPLLVVIGAGFLFRRLTSIDARPASRISLYLLSPALIFSSLVEAEVPQGQVVRVAVFMVLLVAAMAALTLAVCWFLGASRETRSAMMLCTMFSNTGNYGLPLALFAFGQAGFDQAVMFFIMQAILTQIIGVYIAGSGHGGWREGIVKLFSLPQLYAVVAAIAIRFTDPSLVLDPGILNDVYTGISLMGEAAIPLLLVILGVQLAETRIQSQDTAWVALATGIKLLAAIPISYALANLLGLGPLATKLAIVLGSMPTAVNVTIMALEFDVRPKLVSGVVIVSTALSFVTLTALLGFLGTA